MKRISIEEMKARRHKYLLVIDKNNDGTPSFSLGNGTGQNMSFVNLSEERAKEWYMVGVDYQDDHGITDKWQLEKQ